MGILFSRNKKPKDFNKLKSDIKYDRKYWLKKKNSKNKKEIYSDKDVLTLEEAKNLIRN